jgi:hypothetical protein
MPRSTRVVANLARVFGNHNRWLGEKPRQSAPKKEGTLSYGGVLGQRVSLRGMVVALARGLAVSKEVSTQHGPTQCHFETEEAFLWCHHSWITLFSKQLK